MATGTTSHKWGSTPVHHSLFSAHCTDLHRFAPMHRFIKRLNINTLIKWPCYFAKLTHKA